MTEPSTTWTEKIEDGEEQRHKAFADEIVKIQKAISAKSGSPGRSFHRKQVLGLTAELIVPDDLPSHAAQGIFALPGTHTGIGRLSNGSMTEQQDAIPDIRGLALSFRDVSGPGSLGFPTDRQDFALINRPTFGFVDSKEFAQIVPAAAHGPAALTKKFIEMHGPIRGPIEGGRLVKDTLRKFTGFATEYWYSAAPLSNGPYAVKVRLKPRDHSPSISSHLDFGNDFVKRVKVSPVEFDLQLQFYVNEEATPIENGLQAWDEAASPFINVALVSFPVQNPRSPEGIALEAAVEVDKFDPWASLVEHRPLGEIMRARKVAYFPSQQARGAS